MCSYACKHTIYTVHLARLLLNYFEGVQIFTPDNNFNLHGRVGTFISLLYKAEKPSVCLSFHLSVRSYVCLSALFGTLITQLCQHRLMGFARNNNCVFEDHKFYLYVTSFAKTQHNDAFLETQIF